MQDLIDRCVWTLVLIIIIIESWNIFTSMWGFDFRLGMSLAFYQELNEILI